ncbi:MAG: aspartyl/asparaginyl beta-hydroxylase domain-containing protein [Pseudomonadota bacterium]
MKLKRPFIQLPYRFDTTRLQYEVEQLSSRKWLPHPSRMNGNEALPLVSRDGGNNDAFDGPMKTTPHLQDSPYLQQCMHHIGEVYGRSRLMALDAGAEVSRHVDFNYHWFSRVRIHIPIVTSADVQFYCGDDHIHMAAGTCWIFDSWRPHRVVNGGSARRIHLVLDTAGSAAFWANVERVLYEQLSPPESPLVFDESGRHTIQTERFNSTPVLAPGEMRALGDDLIEDLKLNTQNDPQALAALQTTLRTLYRDWRSTWALHGYARTGFPVYQALLERAVAALPPPRALTTKSNDLGATPIVMQRIVRAALRPDLLPYFT